MSEFDMPGVMGGTYSYQDDGQPSAFAAATAQGNYDRRMDRTLGYDQFGRLNSSVAGGNGFQATYSPQQDAFGHVVGATYHYWRNGMTATSFSAAYPNDRATTVTDNGQAQTWNYDAMGNRTGITKVIGGTPTVVESIGVDAVGRGVAAGVTLDGRGEPVIVGGGTYYLRSSALGGEIVTELDGEGHKRSGRVLDGANLIAEQLNPAGRQPFVRWHHRDPLNLVARDTEAGQVVRRVHAVTPNGAQVETTDGVDLNRYYACLLGGDNNPTCTGYTPQPASSYGYLADQANGMLAGG